MCYRIFSRNVTDVFAILNVKMKNKSSIHERDIVQFIVLWSHLNIGKRTAKLMILFIMRKLHRISGKVLFKRDKFNLNVDDLKRMLL